MFFVNKKQCMTSKYYLSNTTSLNYKYSSNIDMIQFQLDSILACRDMFYMNLTTLE